MLKQKVLITGSAGFIGSNLSHLLSEKGYDVYGVDDLSRGQNKSKAKLKKFYKVDITDYEKLKSVFSSVNPDYVIHLAAWARVQPSIIVPDDYLKNNVLGTLNVLLLAREYRVKKFVYASSSSVYGDAKLPYKESRKLHPLNPYALTKLQGEQWVHLFNEFYELPTISFRFFNVYGRWMTSGTYATVITKFIESVKEGKPLTIFGSGNQKRDFTNVSDICNGLYLGMIAENNGVYNLGGGNPVSINELASMFSRDVFHDEPLEGEVMVTEADISKADLELCWTPKVSIKEGVEDVKKEFGL